MSNFYQEELLEHYKYPKNKKSISHAHFAAREENPSCGDKLYLEGKIDNNTVIDIGFGGSGCVISQATASMLTDHCVGKKTAIILSLTDKDVLNLVGITLGPVRIKCATLSLEVLKKGLTSYQANKVRN